MNAFPNVFFSFLGDVYGRGEGIQHRAGDWDVADKTEGNC